MTMTIEANSVDDLLSFLRSSEPLPRRTAPHGVSKRARNIREVIRPTAIEAATMRRPPRASERRRERNRAAYNAARSGGDYPSGYSLNEQAEALERVETRVVGWLVAKSLGDAWRWEQDTSDGFRRCHEIVHRATGATLSWRRCWNDAKRYEIVPENLHRAEGFPRSITVSAERTPADIARDIERRIVGAGLFDQNAGVINGHRERRRREVEERLKVLAVSRAYGGTIAEERHWRYGHPVGSTGHFGPKEVNGYIGHESTITASIGYSGIELEVNTADVKLAIKVAELVRRHYRDLE